MLGMGIVKAPKNGDQASKDAKELVDGAPKTIKEAVSKDEAEGFKKSLEEAGAEVELK